MGRYLVAQTLKNFIPILYLLVTVHSVSANPGTELQKVYNLEYVKTAVVKIDGIDSEESWKSAEKESGISFPWKHSLSPSTSFRAFFSDEYVYIFFEAVDADLVISSGPDEQSIELGDRVELFFSTGLDMDKYFCLEIDPTGRVLDYRASFYRKFDSSWDLVGLKTAGRIVPGGYTVEAAVPTGWIKDSGISSLQPGSSLSAGIFRAEFSHEATGGITEGWMSWQNPGTEEPDFHVPSSLGIFVLGSGHSPK